MRHRALAIPNLCARVMWQWVVARKLLHTPTRIGKASRSRGGSHDDPRQVKLACSHELALSLSALTKTMPLRLTTCLRAGVSKSSAPCIPGGFTSSQRAIRTGLRGVSTRSLAPRANRAYFVTSPILSSTISVVTVYV